MKGRHGSVKQQHGAEGCREVPPNPRLLADGEKLLDGRGDGPKESGTQASYRYMYMHSCSRGQGDTYMYF